jgi:integrase
VPYIRKRGKTWQAIVRVKGHPDVSATRPTKAEATYWAQAEESAIRAGQRGLYPAKTFADALDRYALEVTATKATHGKETLRLMAMKRDFPKLTALQFSEVKSSDLAAWRDARLREVTPGSVQRDINLFRNVWTVGRKEWGWCGDNPWSNLRMPGQNRPRESVWKWQDIRRVLRHMHYRTGLVPCSAIHELAYMFLIALTTGMRAGEIMGLKRSDIDLDRRVILLDTHKTSRLVGARRVPIYKRAAKIIKAAMQGEGGKDGALWAMSEKSRDTLFRRYSRAAGVSGLTFHDARATFATLTARKTDPLTLAKILGHRDMDQLFRTYFREDEAQIAARL